MMLALLVPSTALLSVSGRSSARPLTAGTNACLAPDTLTNLGLQDEARTEYVKILVAQPQAICAIVGLLHIESSGKSSDEEAAMAPPDLCAVGKELENLGLDDEADAVYLDLAKKDPDNPCLAEGLGKSKPERLTQTVERWLSVWVPLVLVATGAIFLVLALPLLLPSAHFRNRYRTVLRRLIVLRWIFRPRLVLESFSDAGDDLSGTAFRQLLTSRFREVGDADGGVPLDPALASRGLDLVSAIDDIPGSATNLTALSPQLQLLASFLGFLQQILPFTRLSVDGALAPAGDRGVGVALALRTGKRVYESVTLWQNGPLAPPVKASDDSGAVDYYSLVPRAAGWLHYQLILSLDSRQVDVTSSGEGYAYLCGGIVKQLGGALDEAKELYESALELDSSNYAALANLGKIHSMQGNHLQALELFTAALAARTVEHG